MFMLRQIQLGKVTMLVKRGITRYLAVSGAITGFIGLCILGVQVVYAQSKQAAGLGYSGEIFITQTTSDPWFWAFIGGWFISAVVSGMPEPKKEDSPFYIWIYRSMHILVATGTAYFQHKDLWPIAKKELEVEPARVEVIEKKD